MHRHTRSFGVGLGLFLALGVLAAATRQPQTQDRAQAGGMDLGKMLFDGLNASPGCLKAIGANTSEGHNTIIAWFEDRAAVEAWYYSETHTRVMRMTGTDPEDKKPMAHVEGDGPVMVMASITLGGERVIPGPMPISQISIELYRPLDAGASVNGRLMPEGIDLPHFRSIDALPGGGGEDAGG